MASYRPLPTARDTACADIDAASAARTPEREGVAASIPTDLMALYERARAQGLPHVYLGYWVADSPKMAYKARFRPSEVLSMGAWRELETP